MDRVTLAQVAEAAGVSVSTASRALARRGDLATDTRRAVLDAADRLGYSRRSTERGRPPQFDPRSIELVVGHFEDAWNDEVIAGARRAAVEVGCDLILTLERRDPEDDWPERVAVRRSSGVILALVSPTRAQLSRLDALGIPVVLLEPHGEASLGLSTVTATDLAGGAAAAEHLLDRGYERFVIVTGRPRYRFGRAREQGFRQAIAERMPRATITSVAASWGGRLSTAEIDEILAAGVGRLGVFTGNDRIAARVIEAATERGLRVPQEVGVVGFDDEPTSAAAGITTVRQPLREMAVSAVHLVRELDLGSAAVSHLELPTRLIPRASTDTP